VQQQQQSSKAAKQQQWGKKKRGGGANKRGKNIEGQLRKPKRDRWSSRPRSRSFWVALAYSMLQRVYSVEKARLVQSGRAETKRQSLERAFYLRSESFVSGGMASPPPPTAAWLERSSILLPLSLSPFLALFPSFSLDPLHPRTVGAPPAAASPAGGHGRAVALEVAGTAAAVARRLRGGAAASAAASRGGVVPGDNVVQALVELHLRLGHGRWLKGERGRELKKRGC